MWKLSLNPDVTKVKVSVNGVPSKVYSQGIERQDMGRNSQAVWQTHRPKNHQHHHNIYRVNESGLFIDLLILEWQQTAWQWALFGEQKRWPAA